MNAVNNEMTVFYLVRHAHAEYSPDEQRSLSEQGQADAERLAGLLGSYPITWIYSSPYQRALQTVTPLAKNLGLEVHLEPDLRERCLGYGPEGCDFISMLEQTWHIPHFSYPEGESNIVAKQRGVGVIDRLLQRHRGEHIALSTHGNLMCLIMYFYDERYDFDFWKALTFPDAYILKLDNGKNKILRIWQPE